MATEQDLSSIDLRVRAQFLKDLLSRFIELLRTHCEGYLIILSEQTDEAYIRLRVLLQNILVTDGFESLNEVYPKEVIPNSLHSLGEDADIDWESGIDQSLNRFKGQVLEFCIAVDAAYDEQADHFEKEILKGYDEFIASFRRHKKSTEQNWLNKTQEQPLQIVTQSASSDSTSEYVSIERIHELRMIKSPQFDLVKLIELCEELNNSNESGCYMAVAMLVRAVLDHVPPIFACKNFAEVANNYGGSKSFKQSMANLEKSSRRIGDAHLHTQIRAKEILPNKMQVNFSNDIDVLLAEIVRILKQ